MSVKHQDVAQLDRGDLIRLGRVSRDIIADLQDAGGAYPACPTFSAYRGYAWLRDGSFTAEGMSRAGAPGSADRFHNWVAAVLADRADRVARIAQSVAEGAAPDAELLLPTRFTLRGDDGSDPWWDFQTDGYGTWLWSVTTHGRRHGRNLAQWVSGIEVCVDYLCAVGEMACYDWWEEHREQRHTSTLAAVYGGLMAAAGLGELDAGRRRAAHETAGRVRDVAVREAMDSSRSLVKWIGSDAVDGSLPAAIVPFGLVPVGGAVAKATLGRVDRDLNVGGGVHRFRADVFFGGGQWPLLSCLLGWNLCAAGDVDGAWRQLRWAAATSDADGHLPEQVSDVLLHPARRQEWIDRWGPVATPLLWSHGMYLILGDELGLLGEL